MPVRHDNFCRNSFKLVHGSLICLSTVSIRLWNFCSYSFFLFFERATDRIDEPNLMVDGSNDVFSHQEISVDVATQINRFWASSGNVILGEGSTETDERKGERIRLFQSGFKWCEFWLSKRWPKLRSPISIGRTQALENSKFCSQRYSEITINWQKWKHTHFYKNPVRWQSLTGRKREEGWKTWWL